jgi:hypothetical protein
MAADWRYGVMCYLNGSDVGDNLVGFDKYWQQAVIAGMGLGGVKWRERTFESPKQQQSTRQSFPVPPLDFRFWCICDD